MYDELVKRLRYCRNNAAVITDDELMAIADQAADAIEELSKEVDKWKAKYVECFHYSMELFEENQNLQDVFRPLHEMPLPEPPMPMMEYPQVDGITPTLITPKEE